MFTLRKASIAAFGLVFGSVGVVGTGCSSQPVSTEDDTGAAADDVTTSTILTRAEQWSNAKLLYCQSANGARDYDSACPAYCHRESNSAWNAYRSDCSGLISYAWGLPAPGRVTSQFAPYENDISTRINGIDLRPGDALNLIPSSEHIILFKAWVDKGHSATFIEEPGCSVNPDYAHTFTSNVTISGSSVYVNYEGSTFAAIRYKSSTVAIPNAPARGYLDSASCTAISGWSEDSDSPASAIAVELTFDAPVGETGTGTMRVTANEHRADLCTTLKSCNHGYSVPMPTGVRDGKHHTVYAYGHDVQGGAASELISAKSFTCAPPAIPTGIKRHILSETSLKAWKFDPLLDVAHEAKASVDTITAGADLEAAPTVVKGDDGSTAVYVIDGTFKRHVVNQASLTAWGFAVTKMPIAKLDAMLIGADWPEAPFVLQGEGETAIYVLDGVPPAAGSASTTVTGNGESTNDDSTDTTTPASAVDDGQTGDPGSTDAASNGDAGGASSGCSISASHETHENTGLGLLAAFGLALGLRSKKKK
ncbi:MAG: hypothetical protein ABI183_21075 [Polyangiaceae bacterium]